MNVIRSEWTKLRSVRSTWIAALSVIASSVALSVLSLSDLLATSPSAVPADWDPTAGSFKGFLFAQLIIGMLGAFSVTPEYSSGMIGGRLALVPSRSRCIRCARRATLYLTFIALIGMAVGVLTRSSTGSLAILKLAGVALGAAGHAAFRTRDV